MRFKSDFDIPYGHKNELWTLDVAGMSALRPKIDKHVCTECGTCCLYCPTGAILFDDDEICVVSLFCKGCGICAKECPSKAIVMTEIEEKRDGQERD